MPLEFTPPPPERPAGLSELENNPDEVLERLEQRGLSVLVDRKIFSKREAENLTLVKDASEPGRAVFLWPGDPFRPRGIALVELDDQGRVTTAKYMREAS